MMSVNMRSWRRRMILTGFSFKLNNDLLLSLLVLWKGGYV